MQASSRRATAACLLAYLRTRFDAAACCCCSRFFELYHASRESFVYIRQFYHGEIAPEDVDLVPAPEEPASPEFLQQLREFTPWRLQPEVASHLGSRQAAEKA